MPYLSLFLYDYKESGAEKHKAFTGADNKLIIENLERLHSAGAKILLRCPIIPGLNDREDHFKAIAQATVKYKDIIGAELLPYHRLAASKAGRMGLEAQEDYEQPSSDIVEGWKERVRAFGGRVV
jgi:pyruvate formate lyase activating enzyme